MSVVLDPVRPKARQLALVAALFLAAILPAAAQGRQPTTSRTVVVTVDQAEVMKLPTGVATLVLGNPLIADVSIQSGGMAVLTGKGYGTTNLLALDSAGAVIDEKVIQVKPARDAVVVYRGVERESYSCMPTCERRITLGDSQAFFEGAMGQTLDRTRQGQGAAPAAK
jgi:Flp pilus assembly secretin CpaC